MQAVILAGGLGTRLRPVTEQIPKVMVTVNGRPFLQHVLELLRSQGITDIVLCTGYLGEQVKTFFRDGENLGVMIRYSEEKEGLLGTGGALKQAQGLLEGHFLILNGDTYLPMDYNELEKDFLRRGKKAVMAVYENVAGDAGSNVALDDEEMVKKHDKEGSGSDLRYTDAGALVLSHEALDIIEEKRAVSLENSLYPALIQQKELAALITGQAFYDIGTPERIRIFEEFLRREAR